MSINDPTKMLYSTRFNTLKIIAQDTTSVTIAGSATSTIPLHTHGLGYVPRARVWYQPVSGQIWPLSPNQFLKLGGGTGTVLNVIGHSILTASTLSVRLTNQTGTSKTVTVYWRIYIDG